MGEHLAKRLERARIPRHVGQQSFGLEQARGRAPEHQIQGLGRKVEPCLAEGLLRRQNGHLIGARQPLCAIALIDGRQAVNFGCERAATAWHLEQRQGSESTLSADEPIHGRTSPQRERRNHPNAGDPDAHVADTMPPGT